MDTLESVLRSRLDDPDPLVRMHVRNRLAALAAEAGGPAPEYPPLSTQARGLAGSLATWLRAGCPITPRAERERRRRICAGGEGRPACEQFDADRRRCRACGCFGDVKPWLGTAYCPLGEWDRSDSLAS